MATEEDYELFLKLNNEPLVPKEELPDEPEEYQQATRSGSSEAGVGPTEPQDSGEKEQEEEEEEEEMDLPTGLADMGAELAKAEVKAEKEAERWHGILQNGPPAKRRRGGAGASKRSTTRRSEEFERREEETPKAPLTTFGHSSRPRRSVNYASIERGDEAQAQSLVTDFHSGKKRVKRTRDELDENYVEGEDPDASTSNSRRKKRQVGPTTSAGASYGTPRQAWPGTLSTTRAMVVEKTALEEYMELVPKPTDDRVAEHLRAISMKWETSPPVLRASGGFRKFISWLSDATVVELIRIVEKRCHSIVTAEPLLTTLRHVYNSMSWEYKRDWEYAARMDVFESRMFVTDVPMPLSEILVTDPTKDPPPLPIQGEVRANCCSLQPVLSDMVHSIAHFLEHHDIVHVFGCDFCLKGFPTKYDLTKHECKDFATHMYGLICKQETLTLEAAYFYLCCSQCGLWLTVKPAEAGGSKGWSYFATAIKNHSCKPLVPVVVFFRKSLESERKGLRLSFTMVTSLDIGFPLSCQECETEEFLSVAEAEQHFKEKHEKTWDCTTCSMTFGTEFMYRHHKLQHISQTALFSNYLYNTATFHPPADSGRAPHVGFKSEIPAIGGFVGAEIESLEVVGQKNQEYVTPHENTIRRKMLRWKRTKSSKKENRENGESSSEEEFQKALKEQDEEMTSSSSDSEDSDSEEKDPEPTKKKKMNPKNIKIRGDLGYEHINKNEIFEKSDSEKEARRLLDKLLSANVFKTHERLLAPDEALEILRDAKPVELPTQKCSLADDIAICTSKTVMLPLSNCIDPLKDMLLVNKIYIYCPKCEALIGTDIKSHCTTCQVPEEDVIEVFHAAAGPHAGIRCIYPECPIHVCSIIALRTHLNTHHDKKVNLPLAPKHKEGSFEADRYDRSLMTMAKSFEAMQKDTRSFLARMTDIDCQLPFSGLLESRMQPVQPPPLPVGLPGRPLYQKPPHYRANPANYPARPVIPPELIRKPLLNQARVKPYKIPRTSRWYICFWCEASMDTLEGFADHLKTLHVHTCLECGKSFSKQNFRRLHMCSHQFTTGHRPPGTTFNGFCPICMELHSADAIYGHILMHHFQHVEYIQSTGEMLPNVRDLGFRPIPLDLQFGGGVQRRGVPQNGFRGSPHPTTAIPVHQIIHGEPRMKQIIIGTPTHGVDLPQIFTKEIPLNSVPFFPPEVRSVDTRLMCYLCELTFGNVDELVEHLEEHPEKWARCPFCEQEVDGHFDLQKHLLTRHVKKISMTNCCQFCHEYHRFMCSHMLFRCKGIIKCTICGQRSYDSSSNRIHMQRTHSLSLRRFQCAYCPKVFISLQEYYDHKCPVISRVFWCTCVKKYFRSAIEFCDHFDSVHIQKNRCKLCRWEAKTQEEMIAHRVTHMKFGTVREPQKKLFILVKNIGPKADSGYMRHFNAGAPAPTSYQKVDRSREFHLMGAPEAAEPLFADASAPRTLFDALEGPNAASRSVGLPLSSGSPQPGPRTIAEALAGTIAQQSVQQSAQRNDCVTLSDDDEEMPEIVDVPATGAAATQVNREVRVERAHDGYQQASQHPGYVAEDDAEVEGDAKAEEAEPIVKQVEDPNGDDELAVVAEVENSTGTIPSSIQAGREKKFKCPKCSLHFFTNNAMEKHQESDHKLDAGATVCSETFGVPLNLIKGWLCRNCCVLFEDPSKHRRHMSIHGDTCLTCPHCSCIAFNRASLDNHMRGHAEKKVMFACGTCQVKYPTDLLLMDHLVSMHNQKLLYFCKVCAFGSLDANAVVDHIKEHVTHNYTTIQRFGAVPVQLLNFDPIDLPNFKEAVRKNLIPLHTPSDCTHRSMLTQADTLVSCTTCHCSQPWYNYMANNKYSEETGFPTFAIEALPPDVRGKFPLFKHLNESSLKELLHSPRSAGMPVLQPNYPVQQRYQMPRHQHQQQIPPPHMRHPIGVMPHRMPQTQAHTAPAYAARQTATQQRLALQARIHGPPPPIPQSHQLVTRNHVAVSTTCQVAGCEKVLYSQFDRDLHSMHKSPDKWFCRQCGKSAMTERELFAHYIKDHLTPTHAKSKDSGFKSCTIRLQCPFPTCPERSGIFQAPKAFEKHMRIAHAKDLAYEATHCDARFVTKELCDAHDQKHVENDGFVDAQCCTICGSLDMWSMGRDLKTDCPQSHIIRHGLQYRSSCRECLKQFQFDVNQHLVAEHIRREHGRVEQDGAVSICNLCGEMSDNWETFVDHCRQRHIFNILVKSSLATRGELVVTAGEEYENFTGLQCTKMEQQRQRAARQAQERTEAPSTSSASATVTENGGNTALLTIAAAIGEPETSAPPPHRPPPEVYTIDSD
ncbi:unnamed protein product [Caenorhabditis nigoni]